MEKVDGHRVFRTVHAEEKAKLRYEELKNRKMEEIYQSIQSEFESTTRTCKMDCVKYFISLCLIALKF